MSSSRLSSQISRRSWALIALLNGYVPTWCSENVCEPGYIFNSDVFHLLNPKDDVERGRTYGHGVPVGNIDASTSSTATSTLN